MQNNYFHNNKLSDESKVKKKLPLIFNVDTKRVVDFNILLNRVKLEEKNEMKRKIFFFSFVTIVLGLFGTFITIIR
tara:strand:+ start:477 stop:704 length:228 start_codon:yes stop_codon:yes gene_type:complete